MTTEMKVTNKKGVGFYVRAASSFLTGVEAKEAADGREAMEAKAPVDTLTISGLGEAINVATAVATKLESESVASIAKVETGYPDMTSGRGCAQIAITMQRLEAPNLHKFFTSRNKLMQELQDSMMQQLSGGEEFDFDEILKKNKAAEHKWMEEVGKELLEKSFKVHDKDGNGVLDKEESAKFFSHLVSEVSGMIRGQTMKQISDSVLMVVPMLTEGKTDEEAAKVKKTLKTAMQKPLKVIKSEFARIVDEEYTAKKQERHAAAMKLLDKNGDGQLQLKEFLAVFLAEDEDRAQLDEALGLDMAPHMGDIMVKVSELIAEVVTEAEESISA